MRNICILIFYLGFISLSPAVKSGENLSESDRALTKREETKTKHSYLVGPGDVLRLEFLGNKNMSNQRKIMMDGKLSLPQIGRVEVNNMTLDELEHLVEQRYEDILINNEVNVELIQPRPISVSVLGEVRNPGIQKLGMTSKTPEDAMSFPKVVDAIKKSGGITKNANIEEIVITRRSPSEKGQMIMTTLNLSKLISEGDQSQNIQVYDQDTLKILRTNNSKSDILKLTKSALFNDAIVIDVVGEVNKPGRIAVPRDTTLVQGILRAGGLIQLSANKANIQILRNNESGELSLMRYKVNLKNKISENNNPLLHDGDIVNIRKSKFASATSIISNATEPIRDFVSVYGFYKILSE